MIGSTESLVVWLFIVQQIKLIDIKIANVILDIKLIIFFIFQFLLLHPRYLQN